MKKIFIMFLLSFSFTFSSKFENFNLNLLKKELLMNAYDCNEDGDYLFFKKRVGKYEEKITVFLVNGNVYSIDMISTHFFSPPNKKKITANLNEEFEWIKSSFNDSKLVAKINEVLKNIDKYEQMDLVEFGDYYIRITNFDTEQSIKISLD
ncbi:MAG: hypothetical protein ACRC15_02310 [Cetobacterium sp.]